MCGQVQPSVQCCDCHKHSFCIMCYLCKHLYDPLLYTGSAVRTPINRLTAEQRQGVLQTVVRLNGGKGNFSMSEAVSRELNELDLGDWNPMMADAAAFLKKRDYKADPSSLQIIYPTKPDYVRNFWLSKAEKQFPLLAVVANKLLSAHATTAAAERNWSARGRTYDSLRNRLCIETAEKMVYVKANMPKQWYT